MIESKNKILRLMGGLRSAKDAFEDAIYSFHELQIGLKNYAEMFL